MKAVRVETYGGPLLWIDVERPRLPESGDDSSMAAYSFIEHEDIAVNMLIL
jgi:hypothetical protein